MLATQVSYWANVENARHNKAMERLERSKQALQSEDILINKQNADTNRINARINARNAAVNEINAETNKANSAINSVNALTNQSNYQLNRELGYGNLQLNKELGYGNLQVSEGNLALNSLVADRNYELGKASNLVASRQAAASESQAKAAQRQASAALSQANSARITANANAELTQARTMYQKLENDWYTTNNTAALATNVVKQVPILGGIAEKFKGKSKKGK